MTAGIFQRVSAATRAVKAGRLDDAMRLLRGNAELPEARPATPTSAPPPPPPKMPETARWRAPFNRSSEPDTPEPVARESGEYTQQSSFRHLTFSNAAGSRDYKLFVPSAATDAVRPLIVMLHGCTQTADDFAVGTGMNALAREFDFVVAYPEQPSSANANRCWNWFNSRDQARDQGEPSLIAGITHAIMREQRIDPSRVYVAGLSAGGAQAAIMSARYPDLYAAAGVHSGLPVGAATNMAAAFMAMRQGSSRVAAGAELRPTIVFHGDKDTTVNPANGTNVITQARGGEEFATQVETGTAAGGAAFTRTIYRAPSGAVVAEHWLVHGAGHAWSGGHAPGSFTDAKGPDASRELVRFFLSHKLVQHA